MGRPTGTWPGGKKLAVYVAMGVESYRFGDGHTEDLLPGVPQPDLVNTSGATTATGSAPSASSTGSTARDPTDDPAQHRPLRHGARGDDRGSQGRRGGRRPRPLELGLAGRPRPRCGTRLPGVGRRPDRGRGRSAPGRLVEPLADAYRQHAGAARRRRLPLPARPAHGRPARLARDRRRPVAGDPLRARAQRQLVDHRARRVRGRVRRDDRRRVRRATRRGRDAAARDEHRRALVHLRCPLPA